MKKRIFLGLAPIFLLIVVMCAYAIALFATLGPSIDVIMRENYRSVLAGQQMEETSERMDSGLAFALAGEPDQGRKLYAQNLPPFEEALKLELGNITLPGEGQMADRIRTLHDWYAAQVQVFWQTTGPEARRQMYFSQLQPAFTEIKDTARQIIAINQNNMVDADNRARKLASEAIRTMIIVTIAGIATAILLAMRLQKSILKPIEELTAVAVSLGEGRLDQVVAVETRDELGRLAGTFNRMASKLRAYRQVSADQILHARQMTEITFSAFPDPIVMLSPEAEISFSNPPANRLLSQPGRPPALPLQVHETAMQVLRGGPDYLPLTFDKTLVLVVDDREMVLLPRVIGLRDDSNTVTGVAVILQDVTRMRLADEIKTNLVSTVSHELKTPLTSVRMALHLLLEERIGALNPKQMELLLAAREDSERLLTIINDLLDLARLEAGKVNMHTEVMEASRLLGDTTEELGHYAESQSSRLSMKAGPALHSVEVDPGQISHVFSNLVSNAVKHTPPGEEVVLSATNHDEMVRFSVTDQGPGIPRQHQARIFDRFFRLPGEESRGAGLGLAIAREIVVAHGGSIGVISNPGEGAEFYFDLPAAQNKDHSI